MSKTSSLKFTFTQYLCLIAVAQMAAAVCQIRTVFHINENLQKTCVPCPSNCSLCYLSLEKTPRCGFCDDGFYINDQKECMPCSQNCAMCTGPSLSQCKVPKRGFFFDFKDQNLKACQDEGCSSCNPSDFCTNCKDGYYVANSQPVIVAGLPTAKLECKSCGINNCVHCQETEDQIKNSKFLKCNLCKSGFAAVAGRCESCPANCQNCQDESLECSICEDGFILKKEANTCEKSQLENCYKAVDETECAICESHFFLNNKVCESCKARDSHCSHCAYGENGFNCFSCEIGYFLDDNKCQPCQEDCNHCSKNKCLVCANNKYFDRVTQKCQSCPIANCQTCETSDVCSTCSSGYYFNEKSKTCEK